MMTGATTRSLQVWIVPSLICFRIWLPRADEISAIIEVLKMGKSPAEAQKLDKVVNLMKMMR